jgi:lactate racemase
VISDLTRSCPSDRLLTFLIESLNTAGIPDKDILIIIGLGLHRPMIEVEIDQLVTSDIHRRIKVLNHDVNDTVYMGTTSYGTPVMFYRPLVEADFRIGVGNLEFHWFAGYSGGAKAILPGCASRETITTNHAMLVRENAASGRLDDNPLRLDIEEGVALLGVDFILNVVVDKDHRIIHAIAGDVISAHRNGCKLIAKRGKVSIPQLVDIVIASTGGFPKDINLYQAHKAMQNAHHFLKEKGVLILVAECKEGMGNQIFEDWMLAGKSPKDILRRIEKEFVLGGHKAAAIAAIEDRKQVYLVSELPHDFTKKLFMSPFTDPQSALEAAYKKCGGKCKISVLPEAVSIIPVFNQMKELSAT